MQQICLHMHDPRELHLTAMKHIMRYLQGTPDYGLLLRRSSGSDLVVYTDANWAGCPDTRRSMSGYAVFLGDNLVSWSAKRQTIVSRSSAEATIKTPPHVFFMNNIEVIIHKHSKLPRDISILLRVR
jgi:hypothetical protein